MNIEKKIRLKAVGLYIVTGVVMVMLILFLYNSRENINSQRYNIEKQQRILTLTNELISKVSKTQSKVSDIILTYDTLSLIQVSSELDSINIIIDTLSTEEQQSAFQLQNIKQLLYDQIQNIGVLSRQLDNKNPITQFNKTLKDIENKNIAENAKQKRDTTAKAIVKEKKSFFSRITSIFSSDKKVSKKSASINAVDTTKATTATQPLANIQEMALSASKQYDSNIKIIRKEIAEQISTDREISTQISELLLDLHTKTLNSVLDTIEQSEQQINRNYIISFVGGLLALLLILLFILLIIYDVNKGKEAREKLREVMENRHKLLLAISHDIKSPLGSIMGYLELRKNENEDIKSMQNSARHILALLENLLEFSSLEQGSLTLTNSPFLLTELTSEIEQMFIPKAKAKGIYFTVKSDEARLLSDQMKIKQIIINLVSNALKYTTKGSVELTTWHNSDVLYIRVKDTGAGIPKEKQETIFAPFTRVESNNNLAHGSGLGLYVVKGLIELLQGKIEVESKTGMGTVFNVSIPCSVAQNKIKKGTKRIKVYDDDELFLRMTCDMLTQLGHKVVHDNYDVILTDMEMGEVSGLDILRSAENVPVVVMTGYSGFTTEEALRLGFDAFLPKPFNTEALREVFGDGELTKDSFLGDDEDEIREIFKQNTAENYKSLKQALAESNFEKAQAICHKMQPMFILLGYPADTLKRINANKNNPYPGWEKDIEAVLSIKV